MICWVKASAQRQQRPETPDTRTAQFRAWLRRATHGITVGAKRLSPTRSVVSKERNLAITPTEDPKYKLADLALTPNQLGPDFQKEDWAAAFASQPAEFDYWIDEIEGELPSDLQGTLFRNGPGNFQRGKDVYAHMLDGDGYICRFAFDGMGNAHFRSRYVQTRESVEEQRAGRILFRNAFGTQRTGGWIMNAFDMRLKNPANTNVLLWGKRLLALWEAGLPYELDPWTLETLGEGPATLNGWLTDGIAPSTTGLPLLDQAIGLGKALTAHPHIVPAAPDGASADSSVALWTWRSLVRPGGGTQMMVDVGEFDSTWERTRSASFEMPDCEFNPHDFALTDRRAVFFQNRFRFAMAPYVLGMAGPAQCVGFDPRPMRVYLVPRDGASAPQVVEAESCFLIHHANAWEEGDDIIVWSSGWGHATVEALAAKSRSHPLDPLQVFERGMRGVLGSYSDVLEGHCDSIPVTTLWEHRINAATGQVTRRALCEYNLEHPRVNPLFYSRGTRYVYFNTSRGFTSAPPQAFARLDTATGETQLWSPGPCCFCEELIFVPKAGNAGSGPPREDDGYLLGMMFDAARQRSALVVLDASDFRRGPLARLWLQHHVPHGLHGQFTPHFYGPLLE